MSLSPGAPVAEARATRLADRLTLLALALVVLALYSGAILGGQAFFQRDILGYWYPQAVSFVRAVGEEGVPPLWNPLFAFGLPMLEDPGYQVAYPFTWLNLLLEPRGYFTAFTAVHTLLAAAGLLLFARRLGLGSLPAVAAAVAWSASGPLLSAVNVYHFATLAWVPWVLLAFDRCMARGTVDDALALGSAAGLQALSGSGDVCLMTGTLCVGLASYRWATAEDRGTLGRRLLRTAPAALALAAGLSAVQTLPTLWLASAAPRASLNAATNLYWSVHPLSLLDLVVDRIVAGFPMTPALRSMLFESRSPFLSSLYLGMPAAWLVALGLLLPGRRRLAVWLLAGLTVYVLLALGRHTPVLPLLLKLPLVGLFRYPVKAMLPASLLWALLVGLGWAAWQRPWAVQDRRRTALLAALAVGLGAVLLFEAGRLVKAPPQLATYIDAEDGVGGASAALAPTARRLRVAATSSLLVGLFMAARCASRSAPAWLTAAAALLTLGDLVHAGRTVNELAPRELLLHGSPFLALLPHDLREARIYSFALQQDMQPVRGPAGWPPSGAVALGAVDALRPPSGARFRLAGSYDGDFTGLAPSALSILTRMLARHRDTTLATRLLQLGSVDYVVSLGAAPFPDLIPVSEHVSVFASPLRLFRVPDPLPRTFWVGRARLVSEPAEAIAALADSGFDPRREVILPAVSPPVTPNPLAHGVARFLDRRSDRLSVEVTASGPGYLVVVEANHDGWRASVDGRPATVMPANVLFRAVAVPAGRHVVDMVYRPRSVLLGVWISGIAALAGGAAWLAARRAAGQRRVASSLPAR